MSAPVQKFRRSDVFVVGRQPSVTYIPRESEHFEARITDYIDERGRILIVTGPSKSGKTVLIQSTLPDAVTISGGSIGSIDAFWAAIVSKTGGFTTERTGESRQDTETARDVSTASFKVTGLGPERTFDDSKAAAETTTREIAVTHPDREVALAELRASGRPLVIDDFHHMAAALQTEVVRQLKEAVFEGLPVIFVAVPHHAADVVRAEKEMDGRVEHVQIGLWEIDELAQIAEKGFEALGVECPAALRDVVAGHAVRSPHLMQQLCLELCKTNGISETVDDQRVAEPPADWSAFLGAIAEKATSDAIYRKLVRGPQSRKPRKDWHLKDEEETTDIYGALLLAIRSTGPASRLDYDDIRKAWSDVLAPGEQPQKEQVTNSLKHMTTIAVETATDEDGRLVADAVLEFDPDEDTLYVADPFFAFRLRWGSRILS